MYAAISVREQYAGGWQTSLEADGWTFYAQDGADNVADILIYKKTFALAEPTYSWEFRNKSGQSTITDSSGNGINMNFNEHSSGTITGLNIADNTGITLDGVNDYIISDPITYTKSYSIEIYFKPDSASNLQNWARLFLSLIHI